MQALGMIEVYGYLTAVEALDSALKAANVSRLGVEKVRGGLVTVLVEGDVGAVKAAMDASAAAAERVGTVISVHVIPRPADDVTRMLKGGKEPEEPTPPEPEKPSEPEISSEPDTLSEPESEAVKAEEGEKAPQDVTVEEMQTRGVDALRRLARALEIKNMTRAEIRFAKKQELIQKITEFKES